MNAKEQERVLVVCDKSTPTAQTLDREIADDIYTRRDQQIVKLEEMRLRFAYNAHRHTNENILFICGIMGSFIAALDVYYHFAKFSSGMKEVSKLSGDHMISIQDTVSSLKFQSYSNAFITGYNYLIQMLSYGSSVPSGFIHIFSSGLYSLSQVGAMLTAYLIFLILLLFNILVLQVYSRGLYMYAFGTGIILRDTDNADNTHHHSQRYQLCNQHVSQSSSPSHSS